MPINLWWGQSTKVRFPHPICGVITGEFDYGKGKWIYSDEVTPSIMDDFGNLVKCHSLGVRALPLNAFGFFKLR